VVERVQMVVCRAEALGFRVLWNRDFFFRTCRDKQMPAG